MPRPIQTLPITDIQKRELKRLIRDSNSDARVVRRAQIILQRASGVSQAATALEIGVNRPVVSHWEKRFRERGLEGLADAKGRGRKSQLSAKRKALIENAACEIAVNSARWTVRRMARHAGVSIGTVHSIWKAKGIQPHLSPSVTATSEQAPESRVWDIIGLYLRPPIKALVLCSTNVSDPARTNCLPPDSRPANSDEGGKGGTLRCVTSFLATLSYLERRMFSALAPRSGRVDFQRFLRDVEQNCATDVELRLIANECFDGAANRFVVRNASLKIGWLDRVEFELRQLLKDGLKGLDSAKISNAIAAMEESLTSADQVGGSFIWTGNPLVRPIIAQ